MKQSRLSIPALVAALMISGSVLAEGSVQHFGQSANHLGQSAVHSADSTGHALVGTAKLVSGVVAIPFKGIGSVAKASNALGDMLWNNATGKENTALEISDETVTAGPAPTLAMTQL